MADSLFRRVVVPVASVDDAAATAAALAPHVEAAGGSVVAVHVIEKAGGAPDKASVEQREREAEDVFEAITDRLAGAGIAVEPRILYGTDVAGTILEAAHDADASAVAFTPRGGSRWVKLLAGDVTDKLISETDLPILVLPDNEEVDDG